MANITINNSCGNEKFASFNFECEEGIFSIHKGGTLDVYWGHEYDDKQKSFSINKENFRVYKLFENLYHSLSMNEDSIKNELLRRNGAHPKPSSREDLILWYSDEESIDKANALKISKHKDFYNVEIIKNDNSYDYGCVVRIRTSGSRYGDFYLPFVEMYSKLLEYDFDQYQIDIDEYLVSKRR